MMKLVVLIILIAIILFATGTFFSAKDGVKDKVNPDTADIEATFKNLLSTSQENDGIKLRGEDHDQINFLFLFLVC